MNGVPRLAAYPEGAVGDADSSPGDGQGVFERRGGRVGAGVQPVPFTPRLHLHRKPLRVLTGDRKTFSTHTDVRLESVYHTR